MEYVELPYTEVKYYYEDKDKWFNKDKLALKCDFPNIPYMQDGDYCISESDAVLNYVGTKVKKPELTG